EFLPPILRQFRAQYPTVRLILTNDSSIHQLDALRRQHVDLAIVVPPLHDLTGVHTSRLCQQKMVLAVPATHSLATCQRVQLATLANESFLTFSTIEGPGFVAALLDACQKAGFFPRIIQDSGQLHTILTMVACGMGIALVPQSTRRFDIDGVNYVEVSSPQAEACYTLSFAMRASEDNPVVRAFVKMATAHVDKMDRCARGEARG